MVVDISTLGFYCAAALALQGRPTEQRHRIMCATCILNIIIRLSMRKFASKVTSELGEDERLVIMACPKSNADVIVMREVRASFTLS